MPRDRLNLLLIPVAALIVVLPLLLHGPSCGHDFDFHLLNWFEASAQFRHGILHPLWAISPAYNAGEPRFLFYPPISWTFGALLGLVLPWTWTPMAYTWLALTASGLAMYRLARAHTRPTPALLAATLYLANPYMLFTAYERTAYAELLAAAWLPLLVHAILKARPTIPGIALPLALLWLTNAPAAVMGTYTLAFLALLRLVLNRRIDRTSSYPPLQSHDPAQPLEKGLINEKASSKSTLKRYAVVSRLPAGAKQEESRQFSRFTLALTTLAATALGLSLAAFYIVPAATERPFVQIAMVVLPGMRIADNTLFHHTGLTEDALAHDAVLHTASLIALTLLTATAVALFAARRARPALPLAILAITIAFLLTPFSIPLWHHLPELDFLQFPWRLLAVLATIYGLAAALALDRLGTDGFNSHRSPRKPLLAAVLVLPLTAALALPATRLFSQPCDPPDTVPARLARFQAQSGSEPTDEYTPAAADNDSLKPNSPPFWLSPDPDAPPPPARPGPAPLDLDLTSPIPQHLILNLRAYPDWHLLLNNREVHPADPRADGLITIPLPAGQSHLHLAFRESPGEHAATALSFVALLILLALFLRDRLRESPMA